MVTVWVDGWQLECCGEPFAVGQEVSWVLRDLDREWLASFLGGGLAGSVDKAEEHHGNEPEGVPPTVGTVVSIEAVHCRYAPLSPDVNGLHPVAGSGTTVSVRNTAVAGQDRGDLTFVGYLVGLAVDEGA